jgi:hypothetical protein
MHLRSIKPTGRGRFRSVPRVSTATLDSHSRRRGNDQAELPAQYMTATSARTTTKMQTHRPESPVRDAVEANKRAYDSRPYRRLLAHRRGPHSVTERDAISPSVTPDRRFGACPIRTGFRRTRAHIVLFCRTSPNGQSAVSNLPTAERMQLGDMHPDCSRRGPVGAAWDRHHGTEAELRTQAVFPSGLIAMAARDPCRP